MSERKPPTCASVLAGQRLRRFRLWRGLTLEEVAEKMDCSLQSVGAWEAATREIGINRLGRLAAIYGIRLVQVFAGPLPPEPEPANGIAGIYHRRDGRWYAPPLGKRRCFYGATAEEARDKRDRWEADNADNDLPTPVVAEAPVIQHSDLCDTFEPALMCESCAEILSRVMGVP
jgi:transcriptional regulator with XRE-family HTH domain